MPVRLLNIRRIQTPAGGIRLVVRPVRLPPVAKRSTTTASSSVRHRIVRQGE